MPIAPADRNAPLELSFAQQRLWLLAELDARADAAYAIPIGVRLHGAINADARQHGSVFGRRQQVERAWLAEQQR